jgi:hypothetical protein
MAAATSTPRASVPWSWGAVVLAPLIALGMTAVASIAIALLAIPVAYGITHDGYVALLAVSYGPYAAALVVMSVAIAATAWGVLQRVTHGRVVPAWGAIGGGALAGALGLGLAPLPVLRLLPVPWQYGPALPLTVPHLGIAALAGGMAGIAPLLRAISPAKHGAPNGRAALWHAATEVALFAFVLALVLGAWGALASLLG